MAIALKNNVNAIEATMLYLHRLENTLLKGLVSENIDFVRNGTNQIPGNLSLSFKGISGEMLLHRMDLLGIIVSTGSACDGKKDQVSHVLKSIALENEFARGTIRITLSANNTEDDMHGIIRAIKRILLK